MEGNINRQSDRVLFIKQEGAGDSGGPCLALQRSAEQEGDRG